jgi:manganese/zinc/iron transport system substrate-binding protein
MARLSTTPTGRFNSVVRAMTRLLAAGLALVAAAAAVSGCSDVSVATPEALAHRQVRVATTTNFITDLARRIGGDRVRVTGLMGPGVDPHTYKASAGDVKTLAEADLVLYGGLELEGKMGDVFARLAEHRPTVAVTRDIPREQLLGEPQHPDRPDPHVWFDPTLWERAARTVAGELARLDPAHATEYRHNARAYVRELRGLDAYARERLAAIPERSRVLVTSHDAFRYLGRRYGLDVVAIQGTSTAAEATTADVERVAGVIAERGVKAVFVESSVPPQTIEAVLASAARRGAPATAGRELFSDAAGAEGTPEGTYIGMVRHNVDAIADGLR